MSLKSNGLGYINVNVIGMPLINANKSICFWFSIASTPSTVSNLFSFVSIASSSAVQIGYVSSAFLVWQFNGGTIVTAASNPTTNVLHNLVYTYDGTTHTLYIDGVKSNSSTVTSQTGTVDSIQVFGDQWSEFSTVTLADLRVYNRVLLTSEVSTIYSSIGHDNIAYGLVSRWKLIEGPSGSALSSITAIKDDCPNGNNSIAVSDSISNYTYQTSLLAYKKKKIYCLK